MYGIPPLPFFVRMYTHNRGRVSNYLEQKNAYRTLIM